jgi:hypothetical protein
MKRSLLAFTVLLACLICGALFLLVRGNDGGTVTKRDVSATGTLSSRTVFFGDIVEARLNLILPHRLAGTVFDRPPNFRPFEIVSTRTDRSPLGGGLEQIAVRYSLRCMSIRCLSTGASTGTQFTFPPTDISFNGGPNLRAVWPPLVTLSRTEGVTSPVTDDLGSVPAVFPGLRPRAYAQEALVVAIVSLVVLLAGWFYVRLRVRRRAEAAARAQTLLQTLLARVEAGVPDEILYQQRHALDALAVELRNRHINGTLAVRAERLAWAPEHPDPGEIRKLVTEIRQVAKR